MPPSADGSGNRQAHHAIAATRDRIASVCRKGDSENTARVPLEADQFPARFNIPQANSPIAAAGQHAPPFRRGGNGFGGTIVALETVLLLTCGQVPKSRMPAVPNG